MAQTKAQKLAKQRQRRLDKQYEDLISNFKKLYNQMQLGAKYGLDTPTAEDILKQAGTKSGLKKPTKASIKALKKVQSRSGILRQAYWSLPDRKKEAKAQMKKEFEEAYEEEKRPLRKPGDFSDWDEYYREEVDNGVPFEEIHVPETTALQEMGQQIKRIIYRYEKEAQTNDKLLNMIDNAQTVLDYILQIISSESARVIRAGEKGAAYWFETRGNLEKEDFYTYSQVQEFNNILFNKFKEVFNEQIEQAVQKNEVNKEDLPDMTPLFQKIDEFDDGSLFLDE